MMIAPGRKKPGGKVLVEAPATASV